MTSTTAATSFINIGERTNVTGSAKFRELRSLSIRRMLPLSPRGRGREVMTYGRVRAESRMHNAESADVSHKAELVRGDFLCSTQGPLIRPFVPEARLRHDGAPSPQGEKGHEGSVGVF
jgi:hypothetical protein